MTPHELLRRYPAEALPWLRRQLRLGKQAFAAWLGVSAATVEHWERRDGDIPRVFRLRLVTLVARYLPTEEGRAFVRSLGRGAEAEAEG